MTITEKIVACVNDCRINGWKVYSVSLNKEHYNKLQKEYKFVTSGVCQIGAINIDGDLISINQSEHPFSIISYDEPCRIDITDKLNMSSIAEISEPIDLGLSIIKED